VIANKFVSGAASSPVCGPLASALMHGFKSDAHAQAGCGEDSRRITRQSVETIGATMTCLFFDFDPPGHQADEAWSDATEAKLEALIAAQGGFAYSTRAGWRYVAQLAASIELQGPGAWEHWRARYLAACDALEATWRVRADRLADPSRLFRLGFVVRDGVVQQPLTIGSVERLGAFKLPAVNGHNATSCLVVGAKPRQAPPRAAATKQGVDVASLTEPPEPSARCYRILQARGDIGERRDALSYRVRCPNSTRHSPHDWRDGSTVLFLPPNASGAAGRIRCMHGSCEGVDLVAMLLEQDAPPAERHAVKIVGTGSELAIGCAVVIILQIEPTDGKALKMKYLRLNPCDEIRWFQLFEAADIADPEDDNTAPGGDLAAALVELRGKIVIITVSDGSLQSILPATSEAAA